MKNNNKGFSLIELSIVLIIMGLLVAGITGGASLIKTAQLRSVVTESNTYRTAYNTFYSQYNRVPGATTDLPNKIVPADAWTQLREANIIDKKPNSETDVPGLVSKYKGSNWYLNYADEATFVVEDFRGLNVLYISGKGDFSTGAFSQLDAYSMDEKLDDGTSNEGFVRGVAVPTVSAASGESGDSSGSSSVSELSSYATTGADATKEKTTSLIIKLDF